MKGWIFAYLVRIILAVVLAVLGFRLANTHFPSPLVLLSTLLGAALGFFLPPKLVLFWQKSTARMTKNVALEVAKQLKKRLPSAPRLARKKPKLFTSIILDTSALIDGRIGDILATGFLPGEIILPDFILNELQKVADSSDSLKRAKGRRGLSILQEIKKTREDFKLFKTKFKSQKTDENLVKLAKRKNSAIITTDFNLNKVAKVSGVTVLNVNELSNAVKTAVIPGEELKVKVVAEGKEENQGVGYLEDGTMVVVEDGADLIGKKVKVVVSRLLQTEAGRMIFGKPK